MAITIWEVDPMTIMDMIMENMDMTMKTVTIIKKNINTNMKKSTKRSINISLRLLKERPTLKLIQKLNF